ncbi:frataxin homolog, mitochondrial [Drosophila takahashii]|uniref:frataxin homolog, mitochondrial n=1 Tax=Drosophila takahashii TaxID=29030 RepID=UPI001CF829E7|nr:frataxin homolog, mitochondrial [Drosophila takahashii]
MFAGRLLARVSRQKARLATIGSWPMPQELAGHVISTRTPASGSRSIQIAECSASRRFFSSQIETESTLDAATYERVCSDTLDALCDYFEELTENASELQGTDVAYGDGVLTVNLGGKHGTYVINRQTPNKQIWLSSPTSGPKRFDFVGTVAAGRWIYKHSGQSLHELLQEEIPGILKAQSVDFLHLPYCS